MTVDVNMNNNKYDKNGIMASANNIIKKIKQKVW